MDCSSSVPQPLVHQGHSKYAWLSHIGFIYNYSLSILSLLLPPSHPPLLHYSYKLFLLISGLIATRQFHQFQIHLGTRAITTGWICKQSGPTVSQTLMKILFATLASCPPLYWKMRTGIQCLRISVDSDAVSSIWTARISSFSNELLPG